MWMIDALAEFILWVGWVFAHVVAAAATVGGAYCVVMWFISGCP